MIYQWALHLRDCRKNLLRELLRMVLSFCCCRAPTVATGAWPGFGAQRTMVGAGAMPASTPQLADDTAGVPAPVVTGMPSSHGASQPVRQPSAEADGLLGHGGGHTALQPVQATPGGAFARQIKASRSVVPAFVFLGSSPLMVTARGVGFAKPDLPPRAEVRPVSHEELLAIMQSGALCCKASAGCSRPIDHELGCQGRGARPA